MNHGPQDMEDCAAHSAAAGYTDTTHPDQYDWPEQDQVQQSLELVLEHFLKHTKVVRQKLEIAKEATAQSIEDIEKVCQAYDFDDNMPVLKNVRSYENMWDDILDKFQKHGTSADELHKIEDILTTIPTTIKIHYESLLSQNKRLEEAIEALNGPEYEHAFALANEIQSRPNPMSGLTAEEYEAQNRAKGEVESPAKPQSFKIVFSDKKKN